MKLYEVSLFDTEDGGHLLNHIFFGTAKKAREEFVRVRNIIRSPYAYRDTFTRYEDSDFDLRINVVNDGGRITYFDPPSMRNIQKNKTKNEHKKEIKKFFLEAEWYLNQEVEKAWHSYYKPDNIYDRFSRYFDVVSVKHTSTKTNIIADYIVKVTENKNMHIYIDFNKHRHVISGQKWKGYIMPVKETDCRNGKKRPAVWSKYKR